MTRHLLYGAAALSLLAFASRPSQARGSWLPAQPDPAKSIRLLDCRYDGPKLIRAEEIG